MRKFFTSSDPVVPVHHPRILVELAVSLGADRSALLENVGITPSTLEQADARISYDQLGTLERNAIRLTNAVQDPFKGPITRADLQVDSPYNTYTHRGLPPGPICSPGLASIRAALHPAPGDALYFVSNNHGGHYFADTLAAHYRHVERSRKELKAMQHGAIPGVETPPHATR